MKYVLLVEDNIFKYCTFDMDDNNDIGRLLSIIMQSYILYDSNTFAMFSFSEYISVNIDWLMI